MLNYYEWNYGLENDSDPRAPHPLDEADLGKQGWKKIDEKDIPNPIREDMARVQLSHADHRGWHTEYHPELKRYRIVGFKDEGYGKWSRIHKAYPKVTLGRLAHSVAGSTAGKVGGALLGAGTAAAVGYRYLKGRGKRAADAARSAEKGWSTGKKIGVGAAGAAGLGAVGYGGYRMTRDDD